MVLINSLCVSVSPWLIYLSQRLRDTEKVFSKWKVIVIETAFLVNRLFISFDNDFVGD